mmetsp:Transcript_28042/g.75917  ORF Transcript_28042/g.75917 Transcript_28042/m.75917 type:complete len:300 (+) Transcript_28042:236-1135(+)
MQAGRHLVRPHALPRHAFGGAGEALGIRHQVGVLCQDAVLVALGAVLARLGHHVGRPGDPRPARQDGHDVVSGLALDVLVGVADTRRHHHKVPWLQDDCVLALHAPSDLPAPVQRHEDLDRAVHVQRVAVRGRNEVVGHVVAHLLFEGHRRVRVGDDGSEVELGEPSAPGDVGVEDRRVKLRYLGVARDLDAVPLRLLQDLHRRALVAWLDVLKRDPVSDDVDLLCELVELGVHSRATPTTHCALDQRQEAAETVGASAGPLGLPRRARAPRVRGRGLHGLHDRLHRRERHSAKGHGWP